MARQSMTRRTFVVLGTAGAGALLAACGAAAPPTPAPASPAAAATKPPAPAAAPAGTTSGAAAPTAAAAPKPAQATTAPVAAATKPAQAAAPTAAGGAVPPKSFILASVPAPLKESPALADLVKQGKLPPLKERLPEEPLAIDRKGKYGGTIRTINNATSIFPFPPRYAGGMQGTPLRIAPDLRGYVPNMAKGVEYSKDFKTLTVTMRKGTRWSDGSPHTADDWKFWYEDVLNNKDLTPAANPWFLVGGKMMSFVKVDDYAFRFEFAAPNPAFALVNFAHIIAFPQDNALPAKYLKQFHLKYNDKANDQAKAEKFESWTQWFISKRDPEQNADVPRLGAFMVDKVTPASVTYKRNPYFWMVDAEGKQLPYVDAITMERVESADVIEPRAVAGNYDFVDRGLQVKNFKTYKDSEAKGGFKAVALKSGLAAGFLYTWNLTHPDEVWRKVFQDVRFRRAMSVALDRKEISDVVYFGLAVPAQFTAHSSSRAYKEQYAQAWAQHDPDLANKLLDEAGLKWDAARKVRQLTDGRPAQISYETWLPSPVHEMTAEYWRKVGVQVDFKTVLRSVIGPKVQGNQYMMSTWTGDEMLDVLLERRPKWIPPGSGDEQTIAPLWGQWYSTRGKQGQEPPADIKALYDALDKYLETDDPQYVDKILAYQAENLLVVGTVADTPSPLLFGKDLKNLPPESVVWGWDSLSAYSHYPEAWYYDR